MKTSLNPSRRALSVRRKLRALQVLERLHHLQQAPLLGYPRSLPLDPKAVTAFIGAGLGVLVTPSALWALPGAVLGAVIGYIVGPYLVLTPSERLYRQLDLYTPVKKEGFAHLRAQAQITGPREFPSEAFRTWLDAERSALVALLPIETGRYQKQFLRKTG